MDIECKRCKSKKSIKNGYMKGKQRYKCKECGYSFTEGDGRTKASLKMRDALILVLYGLGRLSYNMLANIFATQPSNIQRIIEKEISCVEKVKSGSNTKHIELDEMWHYIGSKKTNYGYSKQLIEIQGKLSAGYLVDVILTPLESCTKS
jgi:transposase